MYNLLKDSEIKEYAKYDFECDEQEDIDTKDYFISDFIALLDQQYKDK